MPSRPPPELSSFTFAAPGAVIFGAGRAAELPDLVRGWGRRALVCTGSRPDRHRDLIDTLPMQADLCPVAGEPTVATVRAALAQASAFGADLVISVGGGSVLDLGKAIAMLLGNGGDPMDYLEVIGAGRPVSLPSVPFAAVPTTAGTGSEVTANAVLNSPEHGRKASLRSPFMLPRVAVVDPLLTIDCPPAVTAASGLDALTQCLEPFVSRQASPITDGFAREGLLRAGRGLRAAYLDGTSVSARTDMSVCSLLSGLALANAKLGAVHGFAGVIGGLTDAAHGAICAALLVPVVQVTVRALRAREPGSLALDRYLEAAALLTGDPNASIEDGLHWLRDTVAQLGIGDLTELGVRTSDVDEIMQKTATASSTRGHPIVLSDDELREVLMCSLS